ncbi:MAG TPA: hypothetical protein VLL28_13475 [Hyphomicrobiaceae bacterium]|nr:hypothetical protein [Hyphomicrobiaceae bacterium]
MVPAWAFDPTLPRLLLGDEVRVRPVRPQSVLTRLGTGRERALVEVQVRPSPPAQFIAAPSVLLVEDNDINALLARGMLEKAGCNVHHCVRRRSLAGEHVRLEGVSQHRAAVEPKRSAKGLVDEGQLTLPVAPQDDIGLIVQEIAISNLVLADLPLNVLERLKTPLQLLADVDEALELGCWRARRRA